MKHLAALFSFKGQINRIQFLIYGAAIFAASIVISFVTNPVAAHIAERTSYGLPGQIAAQMVLMVVLSMPIKIWMWLAVTVKRLRDIGFDVHHAGWMVLSGPLGLIFPLLGITAPVAEWTLVAISVGSAAFLLFMPGHADRRQQTAHRTETPQPAPRQTAPRPQAPRKPATGNPAARHPAYAQPEPPVQKRGVLASAFREWQSLSDKFAESRRTRAP